MSEQENTALQPANDGGAQPPAPKPMAHLRVTKGTGVDLQTLPDVREWAKFVCQAQLNPPGLKNPSEVIIATLKGYELGITPTQAINNIAVINNRPSVWGDLMLSLCYRSGLVEDFSEWVEGDGDERTGHCRVKRQGIDTPTERKFSMAEAKGAGLYPPKYGSSPWKKYTDRMLQMRARAFALRDTFPDFIQGLGMIEEVRDYEHPAAFDPTQTRQYQSAADDHLLAEAPESQQEAEPEHGANEVLPGDAEQGGEG